MNWLSIFHRPDVSSALKERLNQLPEPVSQGDPKRMRWVVLDLESSGLDMRNDRILSIGAIAVEQSAVQFDDCHSSLLHAPKFNSKNSVLIHGLTPQQLALGKEPSDALVDLLEFIGDSPVVAWQARFDRTLLANELQRHLKTTLRTPFVDLTQWLALRRPRPQPYEFAEALALWNITQKQRHNAFSDAFATACLLLPLLHLLEEEARFEQLLPEVMVNSVRPSIYAL